MGHPCIGFKCQRGVDAYEHWREHLELMENYGSRCAGHYLHTWDGGYRALLRCKDCGGYILLQVSEFHGMEDDDVYRDYFPVSGPQEAAALNEQYNGSEIEDRFPGRYIIFDGMFTPHWSEGEPASPPTEKDEAELKNLHRNFERIRKFLGL